MDSNQVRDLARKFHEAAKDVNNSQMRLNNSVNLDVSEWQGKSRLQFNSDFEETVKAYRNYEEDLLETSNELLQAAYEIDRIKAEILEAERLVEQAKLDLKG